MWASQVLPLVHETFPTGHGMADSTPHQLGCTVQEQSFTVSGLSMNWQGLPFYSLDFTGTHNVTLQPSRHKPDVSPVTHTTAQTQLACIMPWSVDRSGAADIVLPIHNSIRWGLAAARAATAAAMLLLLPGCHCILYPAEVL
jgi:hypothetical protein